jgi:hypothetical protein
MLLNEQSKDVAGYFDEFGQYKAYSVHGPHRTASDKISNKRPIVAT